MIGTAMNTEHKEKKSPLSATIKIIIPPQATEKAITIEPNQTLVFGHGNDVDVPLPTNQSLSARHFSIHCHEDFCQLTLLSANGLLLLNNQPVTSIRLANHDRIQAGDMVFQMTLSNGDKQKEKVLALLQKQSKPLYAIVDTAQDEKIFPLLQQYPTSPQKCLFEGVTDSKVATASPYLVQFNSANDPFLEQLVMQGWGENWCVYINEPESFATIFRHLRQCLRVKGNDGYMLFRFYDPRVFSGMIPRFKDEQLKAFFGPIQFYLLENPGTQEIMRCQILNNQFDSRPESKGGYLRQAYQPTCDNGRMTALHQGSTI